MESSMYKVKLVSDNNTQHFLTKIASLLASFKFMCEYFQIQYANDR